MDINIQGFKFFQKPAVEMFYHEGNVPVGYAPRILRMRFDVKHWIYIYSNSLCLQENSTGHL